MSGWAQRITRWTRPGRMGTRRAAGEVSFDGPVLEVAKSRREWFYATAGMLVVLAGWLPRWGFAQVTTASRPAGVSTRRRLTLRDQLARGLRARRPGEFAFIDRVVELVEEGRLSLRIVQTAYLWSRNKRPYPMIYFEQALRRLAARQGVTV